MRFLYNLLFQLAIPFILLRLYLRGKTNQAYRMRWKERFAYYEQSPYKKSIWVHAVSLGEAIAAVPLIKALQNKYPDITIVATTMTPTGSEKLRQVFADKIIQVYVPYDYSGAIKRFLRHFNPILLVIMETELWPNLLHYSSQKKIPIFLANARLSDKSYRHYKFLKFFAKKMLNCITFIAAQSASDGDKFLSLGFAKEKLLVTGNIKFDMEVAEDIKIEAEALKSTLNISINRPIWIAASTHQGEEEKILIAFKKVLQFLPNVLLVLVPRHPERFIQVRNLCLQQGYNVICYTEKKQCDHNVQILLGDIVGKLLVFYSLAEVAFVGGSLVSVGGHNLLEPAAVKVPILTGSNLNNFQEISSLMFKDSALIIVKDENELAEGVLNILQNKNLAKSLTNAATIILEQNKGALKKLMQWIDI